MRQIIKLVFREFFDKNVSEEILWWNIEAHKGEKNVKLFHFNNFFVILFSQAKSGMESIASKQQGNTYCQGPRFIFKSG